MQVLNTNLELEIFTDLCTSCEREEIDSLVTSHCLPYLCSTTYISAHCSWHLISFQYTLNDLSDGYTTQRSAGSSFPSQRKKCNNHLSTIHVLMMLQFPLAGWYILKLKLSHCSPECAVSTHQTDGMVPAKDSHWEVKG